MEEYDEQTRLLHSHSPTQGANLGARFSSALGRCYLVIIFVLTFLLNYVFASLYTNHTSPMATVEGFYMFLYIVSIMFLVVFLIPAVLPSRIRNRFSTKKSHLSKSVLLIGLCLGTISVVYCIVELIVFMSAFPCPHGDDGFYLTKMNSLLAAVLIFLEIFHLIHSRLVGEFSIKSLKFLRPLFKIGKLHILATNFAMWVKILTKETVVYAMDYHLGSKIIYKIQEFTNETQSGEFSVPPYKDPCEAYDCFNDFKCQENTRNLWTLEEGFSCKTIKSYNHFGSNFYPFFAEFCTLMTCVYFEQLEEEEEHEQEEDVREEEEEFDSHGHQSPAHPASDEVMFLIRNPPYTGLLIGLIPLILVLGLVRQYGSPMIQIPKMTLNSFNIICFVVSLALIRQKIEQLPRKKHLNNLDENILFVTLFGVTMISIAELISTSADEASKAEDILSSIDCLLQVGFICSLSDKIITSEHLLLRNILTFSAMVNASYWVSDFYLVQDQNSLKYFEHEIDFYGFYGWTVIFRVCYPLLCFFRFHSCLLLFQMAWKSEEPAN